VRPGGPGELARDLGLVADLPARTRDALWSVLGPSLRRDVPDSIDAAIEGFCSAHACPADDLAKTIGAWRRVLRGAHTRGMSLDDVVAEVEGTLGGAAWVRAFVAPGFEAAMTQLSREAGHLATLEHGRVLVGADFRVDTIELSQHGPSTAKVTMLTLRTRDGTREERLTVASGKEALLALRDAVDRALARMM
jgi:hypothetical protein